MTTLSELRGAIGAVPVGGVAALFLPPDAEIRLDGTELVLAGVNVTLMSRTPGALLDAQHASRIFCITGGGHLSLNGVRLSSGGGRVARGAGVNVLSASVAFVDCVLSNCTAASSANAARGGALCTRVHAGARCMPARQHAP